MLELFVIFVRELCAVQISFSMSEILNFTLNLQCHDVNI